ncbi:MAG: hypothetical protein K2P89_02840, partial [Lachnospiraceae bacterium]|nr:hypothetical protein [Lachnospiraceae bacterium]
VLGREGKDDVHHQERRDKGQGFQQKAQQGFYKSLQCHSDSPKNFLIDTAEGDLQYFYNNRKKRQQAINFLLSFSKNKNWKEKLYIFLFYVRIE